MSWNVICVDLLSLSLHAHRGGTVYFLLVYNYFSLFVCNILGVHCHMSAFCIAISCLCLHK